MSFRWLADWIIRRARRSIYRGGHLYHADGSLYMGRWSVLDRGSDGFGIRVHHIATPDLDRHFHDHPWHFLSIVLKGGYGEARPESVDPCFFELEPPLGEVERSLERWRGPGSIAFRRATDRHRIFTVKPDTYSLFITWPKCQWWGFYTPEGKVWWRDYPSCHAAGQMGEPITERE